MEYYFDFKGNFVSQECSSPPKNTNLQGNKVFTREWEFYEGSYEQSELFYRNEKIKSGDSKGVKAEVEEAKKYTNAMLYIL